MKGGTRVTGRDVLWFLYDASIKASEASWERTIASALVEQRDQAIKLSERILRESKDVSDDSAKRFTDEYIKWLKEDGNPKIQRLVQPLLVSTGTRAVRFAASRIGVSFSLLQPGLMDYADSEAAFLAEVMGTTTGEKVVTAVSRGLSEGDTISDLTKRLKELPAFNRDRAKLVARTETTRAWNGAQQRSLSTYQEDTGNKIVKEWLSARDARVRDEHKELDGEQQAIDDPFSNGLQSPGEPNCRCTLVYELVKE